MKNNDKLTFYHSFYLLVIIITHQFSYQISYFFVNYNVAQSFLTWVKKKLFFFFVFVVEKELNLLTVCF